MLLAEIEDGVQKESTRMRECTGIVLIVKLYAFA